MTQDDTFELILCIVALVCTVVANEILYDKIPKQQPVYRPVGKTRPRNLYTDTYGTPFFKRLVGIDEPIFDYIAEQLHVPLSKPRNIHFKYTAAENDARRRRSCKMSINNRLMAFLIRMKSGKTHWKTAFDFRYQISSL